MSSNIGVIFDMDGTLLDTERIYQQSLVQAQAAFGIKEDPSLYINLVGSTGAENDDVVRQCLDDRATIEEFKAVWIENMQHAFNTHIPVKEYAVELLDVLSDRKVSMAIATSTGTPTALFHLEQAGILSYFECVIGLDQVANSKPHPEPFLMAAHAIGRDIANCYAFEDSEMGTRAALASGAKVAQIPDLIQPSDQLRANGHVIADDLMAGARALGLV